MPKTKIHTKPSSSLLIKIIVLFIGFFLIASLITTSIKNFDTNSTKSTSSQDYDFYVPFDKDFVLSADYFQNYIKTEKALTKVRIDVLPDHSTLKLNSVQVVEGQEINTSELSNLVLHPFVDEYDAYRWSGFDGTNYFSPIEMKIGVGVTLDPELADFVKTTPVNTTLAFTQNDFETRFSEAVPSNGPLESVTIISLPSNGTLKIGATNASINDVILTNNLGTLTFEPNNNFAGNTAFTVQATDGVLLAAVSNITIVVGECSGGNASLSADPNAAISYSSVCIKGGAISLYPSDSSPNNDICTNAEITYTIDNPTTPVINEGVTCNADENSISLGTIATASIRQHPYTRVNDSIFDDLRGFAESNYTVTAEISNFVDNGNPSNIITLGSNPDGALANLDEGILTSVTIVNGGTGYTNAPTIAFTGGGGSGATAVAEVSGGVITRINLKSYGTGYTSEPSVVIVPNGGGSDGEAYPNLIPAGSNLNPLTSNPEATIFAELDPSVGIISMLKPSSVVSPANFNVGPRALATSATTQYTMFSTDAPISIGRYKLDDFIFGLRVPAYLNSGDYRATIVQTIIADNTQPNQAPIANNSSFNLAAGDTGYVMSDDFTLNYSDPENDSLASIKIVTLPIRGFIKLNGVNVSAGAVIPFAQLGNLTYDADATFIGSTPFTWSANDGNLDSNIATMTIVTSGAN